MELPIPTPEEMTAFIDRMMEAGFLSGSARDAKMLVLRWTPKGIQLTKAFRELIEAFDDRLNAKEVICLLATLERLGPDDDVSTIRQP